MRTALGLIITSLLVPNLWAYDTNVTVTGHELPNELRGVGVEEHLGAKLDRTLTFADDQGQTVSLGTYLKGDKPVLLAMVYYNCPSLCNFHLNGLTDTMKELKWTTGREYEFVAVSMDATETPDLASKKKINHLKVYDRPLGESGWHFLTGSKENVQKLADQLGFKFQWMADKQQFAHAAVAYVITPEGSISRYLHGIQVAPQTLRLSLIEASNGKIGSVFEQVLMFCFQFDPAKNKYTLYAWNIMRIGGILMVLALALFLIPVWWRDRKNFSAQNGPRV